MTVIALQPFLWETVLMGLVDLKERSLKFVFGKLFFPQQISRQYSREAYMAMMWRQGLMQRIWSLICRWKIRRPGPQLMAILWLILLAMVIVGLEMMELTTPV